MSTNQKKAYIFAMLAVLFWSTVGTAFKISLKEIQVTQLLLLASFFSTLILFILIIFTGKLKLIGSLTSNNYFKATLSGLLNPFLYYLILFEAYRVLPAQEALTLNYTWAIMIVIFSIIFLKQKIRLITFVSILISFIGVIIIATHGNPTSLHFQNPMGTVLALSSSIIWASYWIINLKSDETDEIVKLFLTFLCGFIYILIYSAFTANLSIPTSIKGILGAFYIGIFEMSITFYFWLKALKLSENTAKVSSLIFLSPFISLNLFNIILGEKILLSTIAGLIMIIAGILISRFK